MGSFDFTCTVSGLPIRVGDKVRFLLLSENPYGEPACSMHDCWFPRVFPLKAQYNDYGSIQGWEKGPQLDIWMDGLKLDLHEVGTGENPCHDTSTSKDMSFEELLDAVREQRVLVQRSYGDKSTEERCADLQRMRDEKADPDDYHPLGFPTLNRVRRTITLANLPLYKDDYGKDGYMVDVPEYGTARVRWHGHAESWGKELEKLQRVKKFFPEYASIIVAGSNCNGGPDLMLFIPPGTKTKEGHKATSYIEPQRPPLAVRQAMIHEEVWQIVLKQKMETFESPDFKRKQVGIAYFRKAARKFLKSCLERVERERRIFGEKLAKYSNGKVTEAKPDFRELRYAFSMMADERDNPIGAWVGRDEIPYTVGWGTHWQIAVWKHINGKLDGAELEAFLDTVAESCFVSKYLMYIRYWWRPSYSCGPQFGEYKMHEQIHTEFAKLSRKLRRKNG